MKHDLFNNQSFDNFDKKMERGVTVFLVVWAIWAVISLALTGGVIYVAWHFISKYW